MIGFIIFIVGALIVTGIGALILGPAYLTLLLVIGAIACIGGPIWLFIKGDNERAWLIIIFEFLMFLNLVVAPAVFPLYFITVPLTGYVVFQMLLLLTRKS